MCRRDEIAKRLNRLCSRARAQITWEKSVVSCTKGSIVRASGSRVLRAIIRTRDYLYRQSGPNSIRRARRNRSSAKRIAGHPDAEANDDFKPRVHLTSVLALVGESTGETLSTRIALGRISLLRLREPTRRCTFRWVFPEGVIFRHAGRAHFRVVPFIASESQQ